MEPRFPLEFVVEGVAASAQAGTRTRADWKERVRQASRGAHPDEGWATEKRVAVTLFYFPEAPMRGDVDNLVKPVLDALIPRIYLDDAQVERVVVQRFDPDRRFRFSSPSATLTAALEQPRSALYVKISDDPVEELT